MSTPQDTPTGANLLQPEESREHELRVADAAVVLTTRRLLVIREQASPRVRAVDRANLGEVRTRTASERDHLTLSVQWAGLALVLLGAWWAMPLEAFLQPVAAPPEVGFDRLFAAVNTLAAALRFLDEAFLAAGLLALGWAVLRVGRYLVGRQRVLELTVAGEEPIVFPASADDETVARLRQLVASASTPGDD